MRHKDPELMNRISRFIGEYYREHHSTPSTRQIASAMGVADLMSCHPVALIDCL